MHSYQPHFPGKPMQPLADQFAFFMQTAPLAPVFSDKCLPPIIDTQPSNARPRDFLIFDHINHKSHPPSHPEISSKFFYPNFGVNTIQENIHRNDDEINIASSFKENSDDIDALLMSTEIEEEYDDDEISTARTGAINEYDSQDSCSNFEPLSKSRLIFRKSYESHCDDIGKKRQRIRKMVNALKGIVPGANRMSTVAVLDEAVRYLKSMKMDMQRAESQKF